MTEELSWAEKKNLLWGVEVKLTMTTDWMSAIVGKALSNERGYTLREIHNETLMDPFDLSWICLNLVILGHAKQDRLGRYYLCS